MIVDLIKEVATIVGVSGPQVGIAISLLGTMWYWNKITSVLGSVKSITTMIVFSTVLMGMLSMSGIISFDLGAVVETGRTIVSLLMDAVSMV